MIQFFFCHKIILLHDLAVLLEILCLEFFLWKSFFLDKVSYLSFSVTQKAALSFESLKCSKERQ